MKKKFTVSGMTCAACSSHVERAVGGLSGVNKCEVSLLTNSMTVDFSGISVDDIIACVKKSGYDASEFSSAASEEGKRLLSLKRRLILSAVFLVPLFYITMGAMLGAPIPFFFKERYVWIYALTQIALTLPIIIINYRYFTVGYSRLLRGAPNMDSLIAIGSSAAFVYGIFAFIRIVTGTLAEDWGLVDKYCMNMYFESAGTILTLVTLGKFFEGRSRGRTGEAIERLIGLAPKTAVVVVDGVDVEKKVEEIKKGDIIRIRPGDKIPVDGVITEGGSALDQSVITGESIPVYKTVGDSVVSGSVNAGGTFLYVAEKVGEDTTLRQIIKLVEEAASSKAPISKLADKVSGIFVPVVIAIALISFGAWMLAGKPFEFAMSMGISVLVISCPCALGLATPVAIMVGTGKGAENGILIKSAESFEALSKVDTVVLDKTGTVTKGRPSVTDVIAFENESRLLSYALALEKGSEHPLAEAVAEYCTRCGTEPAAADGFMSFTGRGVECRIDNERFISGNAAFMKENGVDIYKGKEKAESLAQEGKTPLFFALGERLLGIIAVRDEVKPTSAEAIRSFKELGLDVVMMTGDNSVTANAIGKEVGVDRILAEVLPQNKEREVYEIMERGGVTAMVGDGINDAPALTRSNVGIAVGAGADVAIESADIVLLKSDLKDAVNAVRLSRRVMRIIKMNLFFAFVYNVIGIPIAAGAFYYLLGISLSPMLGAAAMSLSSVCVVSNALRIRNFKPEGLRYKENKKAPTDLGEISENKEEAMERSFTVKGMMCEHCKARVEQALNAVEGVSDVRIDLGAKKVTVSANDLVTNDIISSAIRAAGYEAEF